MKSAERENVHLPKLKFVRIGFEAPAKKSKNQRRVNKIDESFEEAPLDETKLPLVGDNSINHYYKALKTLDKVDD